MAEERVFSLTFGQLVTISNLVQTYMVRDSAEFALFGIDAAEITEFDTKINAFESLRQDSSYEQDVKEATFEKHTVQEELYQMIKALWVRVKLVFGDSSFEYGKFYVKDMTRLSDGDFYLLCKKNCTAADDYKTELLAAGFTPAMLTALIAKTQEFEDKYKAQDDLMNVRMKATDTRIKSANEIYELLIKYTETGKIIWQGVDQLKYDNYIINPTTTPDLLPPPGFRYSMYDGVFSWEAAEGAMNYELEAKEPGSSAFVLIYDGNDLYYIYRPPFGISEYRIRSAAPGMTPSVWSNKLIVDNSIPAPPTNLQINLNSQTMKATLNWNMVQGAFRYKVYRSSVAPGLPPDTWMNIATIDVTNHVTDALPPGMRHYFQVTNFTGYNESEPSNSVFVEIP